MHDFLDFHFLVTLRVQNREKMRNFAFFLPLSLLSKLRCFSSKQFTKIDHTCPHSNCAQDLFTGFERYPIEHENILKPSKLSKITIKKSIKFPEYQDNKNKKIRKFSHIFSDLNF